MTDLSTFRDGDGIWHAHERSAEAAMCGLAVPPPRPGRRSAPNCKRCVEVARVLPVEQLPAFWKWDPARMPATKRAPVPQLVKADPETPQPRADGKCVVCLKRRRRPAKSHRSALVAWERDPFCSTECAKQFFGLADRHEDGWQSETARREFDADAEFLEEDAA